MQRPSRYSIAAGSTPDPSTASTAAQPSRTLPYAAATGSASAGAGIKRSQAAVMIPSVPSLPISSERRSNPATSLRTGPPKDTNSPGAITASTPVTQRPVTPYLKACGPPALVARLPAEL